MPVFGGASGSIAYALNRDGSVVGSTTQGGVQQAFVWKPNSNNSHQGTQYSLDQFGSGTYGVASAISTNGTIAGYTRDSSGQKHLTTWNYSSLAATGLRSVSGAEIGVGVNDAGQIAFADASSPYVYDSGTSHLLQASWGGARAINAAGDAVGAANNGLLSSYQGTLWTAGAYGTNNNIGAIYGSPFTGSGAMHAINNSRRMAGYVVDGGVSKAVVWDWGFAPTILPLHSASAYGVNDQGDVVGYYNVGRNPFLWENGSLVDLQSEIDPLSGWSLQDAYDINELGQIVGYGYLNGQQRGYLLTPVPEPATMAALSLGLAGLITRKRRIQI